MNIYASCFQNNDVYCKYELTSALRCYVQEFFLSSSNCNKSAFAGQIKPIYVS
jgi:hypothetical protein